MAGAESAEGDLDAGVSGDGEVAGRRLEVVLDLSFGDLDAELIRSQPGIGEKGLELSMTVGRDA